jgi:hypothetical protein
MNEGSPYRGRAPVGPENICFFLYLRLCFCFFMFSSCYRLYGLTDGPDKGYQLTGDGGDNSLLGLASGQEAAITGAEPQLRLPGNLADVFRQALLALEQGPGDPGSQALGPSSFHQDPPGMAIAGFGDTAPAHRGAAGVL